MKSCNRTHENIWWRRGFFQGEAVHCSFAGLILWLPKTSATRLHSFCLWEPAVVLEAFKLKVFKCPNKVNNFFWVTSVSVNLLVPIQKQINYHCHIELHLSCSRIPGSTSVFFSSMKVRLNGLLPPWAVVTQNHKLFNSTSFRSPNADSRALVGRLPKLSCITPMSIILENLPHFW